MLALDLIGAHASTVCMLSLSFQKHESFEGCLINEDGFFKIIFQNFFFVFLSLQDLIVLSMKFFRRRKTHIRSVINLPTEMLRRRIVHR
jgi:hypothetical protein